MAGVQLQRSNPPRMFTTDDEAYGQEHLSLMFPRCMGAKAAVEPGGVGTGFTRLVDCWSVPLLAGGEGTRVRRVLQVGT